MIKTMHKLFYSRETMERWADSINKTYFPERLDKATPLDSYNLLEKLGLEVEWKYLSPNLDIQGAIFFDGGTWLVWDKGTYEEGDKPHKEAFNKRTIVINAILSEAKYKKKERFVVGHEVTHWIKDIDYFTAHPVDQVLACSKEHYEKTYWNRDMSERDIIERQCNYMNAALQMPRHLIKKEFFKLLRYKNIPDEPIKYKGYMKGCISKLAEGFELNFNPVLYRLYDLNVLARPDKGGINGS